MICPSCRNIVPDNAKFCGMCGLSFSQPSVPSAQNGFQQQGQIPYGYQMNAQSAQSQYQAGQSQTPIQYWQQDPSNATKRAMADIKATPGWIKRIFLLTLMRFVPVLGLYATGYSLQWGVDAVRHPGAPMPRETFNRRSFAYGLFCIVLNILFYLGISWIAALCIIPVAGWIAAFVLLIIGAVFTTLASMRMAVFDCFGSAFDLSELFKKMKIKSSGIYKATLMPWVFCFLIILGLSFVLFLLTLTVGFIMATFVYSNANSQSYDWLMQLTLMLAYASWFLYVAGIALSILSVFLTTLAQIWSCRALGYWMSGYAFDWFNEAEVERNSRTR